MANLIETMRAALAEIREREEKCRDAALALQRLLEAEGALYPEAAERGKRTSEIDAKLAVAGTAMNARLAAMAETQPRAPTPGEEITASAGAAFRRVTAAKKAAKKEPLAPRPCVVCGKKFQPRRRDQRCCSPACGKQKSQADTAAKRRAGLARRPEKAPAAPAAAAKQERAQAGGLTRIERIKALSSGGGSPIPQSVRDAAAEARENAEVR